MCVCVLKSISLTKSKYDYLITRAKTSRICDLMRHLLLLSLFFYADLEEELLVSPY